MGRLSAFLSTTAEKSRDRDKQQQAQEKQEKQDELDRHLQKQTGNNFAKGEDPKKQYKAAEDNVKESMRNITGSIVEGSVTANPADNRPLPGDNMSANDYKMFCDSYGINLSDMVKLPVHKRKSVMASPNPRQAMQRALSSI